MFDANGYFDVTGCHSSRRYRIYYGTIGNIRELNAEGDPRLGLCFAPAQSLAPGDVLLAQKIALETDELGTLAVANCFPSQSRPPLYNGWERG
ncbi:conserved hypothetical protein [Bradyrhizobium sp. ORS 375]|nr:conserved hypothetical protein [Bradyrhizobium sp. ORS 375]